MDLTSNPDRQTPAEVHYDPVSGAGGFLAAGGALSLWFTPAHIMAMIRPDPEPGFLFANPPFGRCPARH